MMTGDNNHKKPIDNSYLNYYQMFIIRVKLANEKYLITPGD